MCRVRSHFLSCRLFALNSPTRASRKSLFLNGLSLYTSLFRPTTSVFRRRFTNFSLLTNRAVLVHWCEPRCNVNYLSLPSTALYVPYLRLGIIVIIIQLAPLSRSLQLQPVPSRRFHFGTDTLLVFKAAIKEDIPPFTAPPGQCYAPHSLGGTGKVGGGAYECIPKRRCHGLILPTYICFT